MVFGWYNVEAFSGASMNVTTLPVDGAMSECW